MSRRLSNMFLIAILASVGLGLGACAILSQDKFGHQPDGERLRRIQASPHYVGGEFVNTVPTDMLAEGQSTFKILWDNLFAGSVRLRPEEPLPTVRLDLADPNVADVSRDMVIWLGHSSYFIQLGGKRILVDPVFSDHGAPFSFFNRIFPGTDLYAAADMPQIDYLVITHDHWDHLDHPTVTELMPKVGTVVCPLGVGAHFERWGYPKERLRETDWNTTLQLGKGLAIHAVPARHYSGRGFSKNKSLWAGFVLETPQRRIYLSGDTGYGPHFADIARTFGSFDLVVFDGGQYDPRWPLIHMTPEEAVLAAEELGAKTMMLAHVGRFSIASHSWDEPFIRAVAASKSRNIHMLTPRIGEPAWLDGTEQNFDRWWEGVK